MEEKNTEMKLKMTECGGTTKAAPLQQNDSKKIVRQVKWYRIIEIKSKLETLEASSMENLLS